MRDIVVAFRQFLKSPGYAITVVLTLALGIGANTAIFTLVHSVLLKSLPVTDPKTLYRVGDTDNCCVNGGFEADNGDFDLYSWDLYKRFRETTPEFDSMAAMQSGGNMMIVRKGSEPAKSLHTQYVSGNFFTTFGVGPYAGRVLREEDDTVGAAPAVVMSYEAWQVNYGGDPSVVGSTFFLQGRPVTVVGIGPRGFFGDRIRSNPPEIWVPLADEPVLEGANSILHVKDSNWLYVIGRLKPGVTIKPLADKMSSRLREFLQQQPGYTRDGGASIIPKQHVVIVPGGAGIENMQHETSKGLYLLMAISGLVLLVACANIANLMLARGATRRAEISVRMALGAPRSRVVRQMLTESVLLACMGGFAGLGVAYAGTRMILSLAFPDSPQLPIAATPSFAVLGFAFGLSLLTGVIFGVVPAWMTSRSNPAEALRGVSRTTRDSTSLPQRMLIVVQAALSLVMLMSAGLLAKSLRNMEHQDFGLQTENRYVVHIDPAGAGYKAETLPAFYRTLEQQFGALPGVKSVGLELYSPLEGNNWGEGVFVDGRPSPGPNGHNGASWDRVNAQFFDTVGQPVVRGRVFTEADTATTQKVAVVNQTFVKKFFPKEDPLGRRFGIFDQQYSSTFVIVGVVADAKYTDPREVARPMYFRPLNQQMDGLTEPNLVMAEGRSLYINSVTLRFDRPQTNLDAMVRKTLQGINPNLTVIDLNSMDYQVSGNFTQERLISRLTILFGLLALVLASVGLYGITSYQVARRTSEIGLRMALGADRGDVVKMVLRGALLQAGIGLAIGIPVVLIAARWMTDQLYQVRSYDPLSLAGAVVVLLLSATVAGFVPARRASRIEPMEALRTE